MKLFLTWAYDSGDAILKCVVVVVVCLFVCLLLFFHSAILFSIIVLINFSGLSLKILFLSSRGHF